MGTLAAIFGYLILSTLMLFGLSHGARWLVTPESPGAVQASPPAPVIPPRIAESIERKRTFVTEPPPTLPAKPVMTEVSASLTPHHQNVRIRELGSRKPIKKKKKPAASLNTTVDSAVPPPPVRGRSDNPYD
jgi:hypothetical protein